MQEAEAQGNAATFSRTCKSISVLLLAFAPSSSWPSLSPRPSSWPGVAFQLGSRVISKSAGHSTSPPLAAGAEKRKKKRKKEGGEGKKALQKQKREFASVESTQSGAEALATPLTNTCSQSKFDAPEPLRSSWGGGGETEDRDTENKTPPGACRSPPPLRIKRAKKPSKVAPSTEGDERGIDDSFSR